MVTQSFAPEPRGGNIVKPPSMDPIEEKPEENVALRLQAEARKRPMLESPTIAQAEVKAKPGEFFFLRCPECNGEGIYFDRNPIGIVLSQRDWFATYKPKSDPWPYTAVPCQVCWDEKSTLVPLRIEVRQAALSPGRASEPTFLVTGSFSRFVCTRSHWEYVQRESEAVREALFGRLKAIEDAKKAVARA